MKKNNNFKNNEEEKYYKKLIDYKKLIAEHETEEAKESANINKKYNQRPLVSKPFDLKPYLPEFTNYQYYVYLSYIYQLNTYMIITNKDEDIFFKPLKIKCNPNLFRTDYEKQDGYEDLEDELRKILKPYSDELKRTSEFPHEVEEKTEDLILEIIDTSAENLSDLYDLHHYTKLDNYKNPTMKKYILDPVRVYHIRTKKEDYEERLQKKNNAVSEIIDTLEKLERIYNENSLINKKDDKAINKAITNFIGSTKADPFLNLYNGTHPVKLHQARAGENITKELNLKRHLKDNVTENLYLYNDDLSYFEEVTGKSLKNKLYNILGFNLTETDINATLKAVPTEDQLYTNLLVFKNLLFDTDTLKEFKPFEEVNTYNRKDYLTINNIGSLNRKNNTINLLDFNKDIKLKDVLLPKKVPEINPDIPVNEYSQRYEMSLTEIVLRQILIPEDNPADIRLFKDYLERLGSNIYGTNLYKVITFYYGDGDNGKSVLNLFNDLIFNNLNYEIKPNALKDNFGLEAFNNRLIISIDEITKSSFEDLKDFLKHITSKYSKTEQRGMHTTKTITQYGFPNITIYSNEMLELNPVKDKQLFSRLDYLKLPNKFLSKKELSKYPNNYPKIDGLEELLSKDTAGLNWLITSAILCYKQMKENKNDYTLKQTTDETIDIYWDVDYLSKFLTLYTEYIDDLPRPLYISNLEIANSYIEYMNSKNKTVDTAGLSKDIGIKLNQIYPKLKNKENKFKETGTGRTMYKLKLKEQEDVVKEFNQVYAIEEDITDKQLNVLNYNSALKTVYEQIQKGNSSITLLEKKLPTINCLEAVKQLDSLGLIYNTKNLTLNT